MNKNIKNIIELNKEFEKEIPNILAETIVELKKLVENSSILSFSFSKNDIYLDQEKPIYVVVSTYELNDIRLGLLESISELEKAKSFKLPKDLKKNLDNLNANLYLLNEHFPKKMPIVKNNSYFSLMAENKEGGFADENLHLFPEFKFETPVVKVIKKNKL